MMKLGSHNSMTYLPVKKWWLKPFKFTAQCQSKNLEGQYAYGARFFDLRVVFIGEDKTPAFAHGVMKFKGNVYEALETLNSFDDRVYCRLLNERDENYSEFIKFCIKASLKYTHIIFVEARNKKDWKLLYDFGNACPKIKDKYSSWNMDTKIGTGWHLDDLFPRIYAICFNKMWRKKLGNDEIFLMQDFVGVY